MRLIAAGLALGDARLSSVASFAFEGDDQEEAKCDTGSAYKERDAYGLFLLDLHLERAELEGGGVLRVAEASVREAYAAQHDEDDSDDSGGVHGEGRVGEARPFVCARAHKAARLAKKP